MVKRRVETKNSKRGTENGEWGKRIVKYKEQETESRYGEQKTRKIQNKNREQNTGTEKNKWIINKRTGVRGKIREKETKKWKIETETKKK